jgi:hypothetical protein
MNKKIQAAILACSVILAGSASVYAASGLQEIKAYLNEELKFTLDGADWYPKDENGELLPPITYNGATYLPVRPVASLSGTGIGYDAPSNKVALKKSPAIALLKARVNDTKWTDSQQEHIRQAFTPFPGLVPYLPGKLVGGDDFQEVGSSDDAVHMMFKHFSISQSPRDYMSVYDGEQVKLSNGMDAVWADVEGSDWLHLAVRLGGTYVNVSSAKLGRSQLEQIAASMFEIRANN